MACRSGKRRRKSRPARPGTYTEQDAQRFATELAQALGLSPDYVMPAYDDPWRILRDEANLPLNVDVLAEDTQTEGARRRLGDRIAAGIGKPLGYVLPLKPVARGRPPTRRSGKARPGRCGARRSS
jgi:uncharacterized protein (DUF2126 family)